MTKISLKRFEKEFLMVELEQYLLVKDKNKAHTMLKKVARTILNKLKGQRTLR